jgi:hypothetical protein
MSVRTALAHPRHPRSTGRVHTTAGPTRHQRIRELELIRALDRRAERTSADAYDDEVAWSPRHC